LRLTKLVVELKLQLIMYFMGVQIICNLLTNVMVIILHYSYQMFITNIDTNSDTRALDSNTKCRYQMYTEQKEIHFV
jgi:hypothetical protein